MIKVGHLVQYSPSNFFCKDLINFQHWKMTLKVRILRCLRRLFLIIVRLTVTTFSGKKLIFIWCIHGLMPNLIKKSVTESNVEYNVLSTYSTVDFTYLQQGHCMLLCKYFDWKKFSYTENCLLVSSGDQIKEAFANYVDKSLTT